MPTGETERERERERGGGEGKEKKNTKGNSIPDIRILFERFESDSEHGRVAESTFRIV